jgi:vacuolar-type H+-ATPase subunit D/Vma8
LAALVDEPAAVDRTDVARPPSVDSPVEELAELRRTAAAMQSQLEELQRRIKALEARISAGEKE